MVARLYGIVLILGIAALYLVRCVQRDRVNGLRYGMAMTGKALIALVAAYAAMTYLHST